MRNNSKFKESTLLLTVFFFNQRKYFNVMFKSQKTSGLAFVPLQHRLWSNWRHCWSNNVGWQKLKHLTSYFNNMETCVINMITQNLYFGFCQTFQPNKCVRDDVHRNCLSQTSNSSRSWTQEAVNMPASCWKLLWGWYVSGFKLMEDQEWAKINV